MPEQSLEEILGTPPGSASAQDLARLSRRDLLRVFAAAPAPRIETLAGEYSAVILPVGVFAPLASFFTHTFFGPGRWRGKAFRTCAPNQGEGYNLFSPRGSVPGQAPSRTRRFSTTIAPSRFDGRPSLCMDYSPYNRFLVHSMKDEIRQVGEHLFLGLGTMAAGGGVLNPAPFALFGEPEAWHGPSER
ncbi:MAG: hypothetical protein HY899_18065 [Deltaproteobacteria bacterium]|nr:hypothetical protein [Deltaproteobacteria bacterium]